MITTLKLLRMKKEKTLDQCSAETGISRRTLIRYENGSPIGNPKYLRLLADYYEVSMETLMGSESVSIVAQSIKNAKS